MKEDRSSVGLRYVLAIITVTCLCGVAVVPLLRGVSPCTHDGGLHYFRTVALQYSVKNGVLFSRWLPDLAFGYGFPFFNYRAPLSYYVGLGLHLVGLPLPLAFNLLYVMSILGSAAGAYLLARDLFGPQAGVLAAVAYGYAPYQSLDALVRGNAPEVVALALMPFILWAFRRLALKGSRWWLLGAILLLSGLYLGHNISSLLFTPFLLAYLIMLWRNYPRQGHWKRVALAFALALGLTAFFWFPALAEKGYVQLYLTGATRNNDFHYNFLSLKEIFALPQAVDTSLMNPPLEVRLGTVQAVLAGTGLVLGLITSWRPISGEEARVPPGRGRQESNCVYNQEVDERRMSVLFLAAAAAIFIFMSTSASVWFWENVPLLSFVQFPWRFVGRASLPVALLAGAVLSFARGAIPRVSRHSRLSSYVIGLLPSVLAATVMLAALPATYPPAGYCPMKSYPTIQDVHRYERKSGLVGVDPVGAYFPIWVQQRPVESPLEAYYPNDEAIARFDESVLPEGAQILASEYGPNRARIVVTSPIPFRGRYLSFYFPGWRVRVDGKPVEVTPSDPEGLLTFAVPPGLHVVTVRFEETPLRLGADAISMLALIGLVVSTVLDPASDACSSRRDLRPRNERLRRQGLLLSAGLLLTFKLAIVDRVHTPFRHPRLRADGTLPGVEHPLHRSYADGLDLIGYDQSAGEVAADGTLRVDLYWTVRSQPSRHHQTVIHLLGSDGSRWSPPDSFRPTDYQAPPPTNAWSPGHYALDSHEIEPLPGTPPGRYDVVLTAFDRTTLDPLSLLDEQGRPMAPELVLGQVTVTAPRHPADLSRLGIDHRLDAHLGPLTLLAADLDRDEAAPGDPVFLTAFWRADEQPSEDLVMGLELLAPDGSVVTTYRLTPVASWYPTDAWRPGEVLRGQHLIYLPADLDTASYTWTLSLSSLPYSPLSFDELDVTAPERTFTEPPIDIETDAYLDDVATLVGATVEPATSNVVSGSALTVTLIWRAEAETRTSYRVFLHMINSDGVLVAQSDGIPADWTRPTTGWVAGEFIADTRVLTVPVDAPVGEYVLYAGLYTSQGGRLSTARSVDAIPVTTVTIGQSE